MLVLSRRLGESICIGDDIIVTVVQIRKDRVRLAFQAPDSVLIDRQEIRKKRSEFEVATPPVNLESPVRVPRKRMVTPYDSVP